jgi:hypothetical protein
MVCWLSRGRKEEGQDNLAVFFLTLIVSQSVQLHTHRQETLLFRLFVFVGSLISFKIPENVVATMGKCTQPVIYSEQNLEGNCFCSLCGRLLSTLLT